MKTASLLRIVAIVFLMAVYGVPFLAAQDNSICTTPDVKPLYPGGNKAMANFIKANIKYPLEADTAKVTGTVAISFIVEKNGSLSGLEIAEGIGYGCDTEALRVVRKMPKWLAGSKGGSTVRTVYKLYIKFPQPE
jgi:periplasmic protein TonB